MQVLLVDLGLGNLHSVARALERAGGSVRTSARPSEIAKADAVVVPGQGSFRACAAALQTGVGDALREVIARERPYLGICLGMQLLFERSEEAPEAVGLGLFPGTVRRFPSDHDGVKLVVPHIGWNTVESDHPLIESGAYYYFVHSFRCVPFDEGVATVEYGGPFCAAVARGPLFACQFHPEKSQRRGAHLLETFVRGSWN